MERKVRAYIQKQNMLQENDKVILGISGGADSVCLFLVMLELKKEYNLSFVLVHVNHGVRGMEADRDQKFVEALGERYGIKVRSFKKKMKEYAKENGLSEEEAGRKLRYECFHQVLKEESATKIAVAHNMNDNAETMLFHLARGSGMRGLCGIPPMRDKIIRPLLCVNRQEIEGYLKEKGQIFCVDATNMKDDYARNRIRHGILPVMEEEINKRTVENMGRAAGLLREAQDYIDKNTKIALKTIVHFVNGQYLLQVESLKKEEPIIQKEVIRKVILDYAGELKDIDNGHIEQILGLLEMESGKKIHLPYGLEAQREYENIRIGSPPQEDECYEFIISEEGIYEIPGTSWKLGISIEENHEKLEKIPKNDYTKWFDYDRIGRTISLRNRRQGDCFQVNEQGGMKKLKDYFIDRKIPREKRDRIPLLAHERHILWIIGERSSEGYKITKNTKTILKVRLIGGKENE
ncbi:MAG: tRNA lysidine(34) synthetase TilS [Acetivibrio sp.]